jgi:hypothetical protein
MPGLCSPRRIPHSLSGDCDGSSTSAKHRLVQAVLCCWCDQIQLNDVIRLCDAMAISEVRVGSLVAMRWQFCRERGAGRAESRVGMLPLQRELYLGS